MNDYRRILIERPDIGDKTRLRLFTGSGDVRLDLEFSSLQAANEKAAFYQDCWPNIEIRIDLRGNAP
jgi:hypothetical protein